MRFSFASLTYQPAVQPKPAQQHGTTLQPELVIELFEERAAIQRTDNVDLIRWYTANGKSDAELRRACELCAAADLALLHGEYVLATIRPIVTTVDERH